MDSHDSSADHVDQRDQTPVRRDLPLPRTTNWRALALIGAIAVGAAVVLLVNLPRKPAGRPPDQVWMEMQAEARGLISQGAVRPAQQIAEAAIPLAVKTFGEVHPTVAESLTTMADALSAAGRYPAADAFYSRALEMYIKLYGPRSRDAAVADGNFALNLMKQERFAEAKRLFDLAVAIQEGVSGPDHADTALAINNLAVMYDTMDDPASAQPLHERALAIRIVATGPASRTTAASQSNLAACLRRRLESGQIVAGERERVLAQAERLYRQATAIRERLLGHGHLDVSSSLIGLSALSRLENDLDAADLHALEALAIRESKLGPTHVSSLAALDNLGRVRAEQGLHDEARRYFTFAAEQRAKVLGPAHHHTLESLSHLVDVLIADQKFMEAESPVRALIAGLGKTPLPRPAELRTAFEKFVVVLENTDRASEGEIVRKEAAAAVEAAETAVVELAAAAQARAAQDREAVEKQLAGRLTPAREGALQAAVPASALPAEPAVNGEPKPAAKSAEK